MKMSETVSSTTYRIFPRELNEHDTLYGGQLLAWLDAAASVSAHRFARQTLVTAGVDSMSFIAPLKLGDAVTFTSIVTGVGRTSIELFVTITGEQMDSGERFLAGKAFMTFVARGGKALPTLEATNDNERRLQSGYEERKAHRQQQRYSMDDLGIE